MENFEPPLALQLSIQRSQGIYPVMIPFAIPPVKKTKENDVQASTKDTHMSYS